MRHARPAALDRLEPLLAQVRQMGGLTERTRGSFYRKSRGFLHFHEDPRGLHADVRLGDDFQRFRVEDEEERERLIQSIQAALGV